ncbi:MAG: flagellin, partial [Roseovarius indicus]
VNLKTLIEESGANVSVDYNVANAGTLVITNDGADSLFVSGQFTNAGSGGLGAMAGIDVSSQAGAAAALGTIETLIDTAIDAAAAFGSVEGRIETQSQFISNLTDSLTSGIGSLVDANMEEASARLQALQVQQQLAVQSLSIANQAPQSILSLFRG